jgi:hypothetical protein
MAQLLLRFLEEARDVFEKHVLTMLMPTERGFFSRATHACRGAVKSSGLRVTSWQSTHRQFEGDSDEEEDEND